MSTVLKFTRNIKVTVEEDEGLIALMQRAEKEAFAGDKQEFEQAFAEAIAQQIQELYEVAGPFGLDMAEELADAVRGVLLQWLGEHSPCPREDADIFLQSISRAN